MAGIGAAPFDPSSIPGTNLTWDEAQAVLNALSDEQLRDLVGGMAGTGLTFDDPDAEINVSPLFVSGTEYKVSNASPKRSFGGVPAMESIALSESGRKMFISTTSNEIEEYALPIPWDISSASFTQSLDVSGQTSGLRGVAWNNDGSKMYITQYPDGFVYEYDVSSAFDISTTSFSASFGVSSQDGGPTGLAWNGDGSKLYISGGFSESVYSYTLTTPFDVTSASVNNNFSVSGQTSAPEDVAWNAGGDRMYVSGQDATERIYEYTASTAFDISTVSLSNSMDLPDGNVTGIHWKGSGTSLYVSFLVFDRVDQYHVGVEVIS